ncbi:MAG: ATP-binding protein [Sphingomonadales bacterium]|nr:ATP-binding protein [Sphingomonadales bacterium]
MVPPIVAPIVIAITGVESSGKSTLALQLGHQLRCAVVPEYGRLYCEKHGNRVSMDELVHIGQQQARDIAAATVSAQQTGNGWVITDTDALFTAVWARMMFGECAPWLDNAPMLPTHYLVTMPDLPFEHDPVRVYIGASDRQRFHTMLIAELDRRGASYSLVDGDGAERFACAMAAVARFSGGAGHDAA